jgi:methyl-accepting chemotaxis protein
MRISTRIVVSAVVSLMTVALSGAGLGYAWRQVQDEMRKSEAAANIAQSVSAIRYLTQEYLLRGGERIEAQWKLANGSLKTQLESGAPSATPEQLAVLQRMAAVRDGLGPMFTQLVEAQKGRDTAGKELRANLEELSGSLRGQIFNRTQNMLADAFRLLEKTRAEAQATQRRASMIVAAAIGLLVLTLAALLTHKYTGILKPLARMREGILIAGGGSLDHRLGITARDEIGDLARSFDEMLEKLKATTLSRDELADGANIVSSAVAQILAVTTQVAASASQTAVSVSETSVTVQEVRQTVEMASQKARSVSDNAQRVEVVAQAGRDAVEEVVQGMSRIREQVDAVAASILRLSEQGQAIGEIIAAVNDLADQSNLLAVNAAIEAARAGEQGRGFAVVAQEVKSLSEQSKQATAQVRSILGEIQKATSAAVLATEQGGKTVEAGVKQSERAGESIRVLAESIGESARAAVQIAASNQQQLVGVTQVAEAMEAIKQASSQNAAGIRQAEAAVKNLHELGARLGKLTAQV